MTLGRSGLGLGLAALLAASVAAPACLNDVVIATHPGDAAAGDVETGALDATPVRVTLVAADPFRSSYDFERRDFGSVMQDGVIKNAGSHILYGYEPDALTVGAQGAETGLIVDLGSDDELASRLGVTQTTGGGQGFAGLALEGDALGDPRADVLFDDARAEPMASTKVSLGHVYALRVLRGEQPDLVVKLLVVEHRPGTDVTFQWIRLR